MLVRDLVSLPFLGLGLATLAFTGCNAGNNDKTPDTGEEIDGDDDDSKDSSAFQDVGGVDMEAMAVIGAAFAFNADSGEIVTAKTSEGGDNVPWIAIAGYDAGGAGCTTFLSKPGPITPSDRSYVAAEELYIAFDMPTNANVETDCNTIEINDPMWRDLMANIPSATWGIGVGPMNTETAKYAADYYGGYFGESESTLLSVGWYWSELEETSFAPNGYMNDPVGYAAELDDGWVPVTDMDSRIVRLQAENIVRPSGGLNKGLYVLEVSFFSILFE